MDLLEPRASYDLIKVRLIEAYDVPSSYKFRELVKPGGMGDRRPSHLLREMRSVLPEGVSDAVLTEFWMQKLPSNVQTVAASLDCPLDALATRADRIYEACQNSRQVDAVRATQGRIETMEATILALTQQVQELRSRPTTHTRKNSTARENSNSRENSTAQQEMRRSPSPNSMYCYYHNRFGDRAKKFSTAVRSHDTRE